MTWIGRVKGTKYTRVVWGSNVVSTLDEHHGTLPRVNLGWGQTIRCRQLGRNAMLASLSREADE